MAGTVTGCALVVGAIKLFYYAWFRVLSLDVAEKKQTAQRYTHAVFFTSIRK